MYPKGEGVCPRCGRPFSYIKRRKVGNRVYLYAVHYLGYERLPNGKIRKKVEECYLGPEDSYEYVTLTHGREGLVLKGLADSDRAIAYLDALIKYLENVELSRELRESLGTRFMRIGRKLLGLEPDIEEVNRILWSNIHRELLVWRVEERSDRKVIVAKSNSSEDAKKICETLERYGYKCELEPEGLGLPPKVIISV